MGKLKFKRGDKRVHKQLGSLALGLFLELEKVENINGQR